MIYRSSLLKYPIIIIMPRFYMALSAGSFDDIVKPEKREEYHRCKWDWLVNPDDAMAKRRPGIFKTVSRRIVILY